MRLIDADAFIERLKKDPLFPLVEQYGLTSVIYTQKTVDPVKHGRWVYYEDETIDDGGRCSVCRCEAPVFWIDLQWKYVETDYCPHCGAKMDEEEQDEQTD